MSKLDEIDRLDKALKDADIRLKSIQAAIEGIDKEISVLSPRKSELEKNLEFHKKSGTIPLAHEYKKSKAEFIKISARLSLIASDRLKAIDACKQVEEIIDKFKRDHMELLRTSGDNVLRVLFGARRGKR